MRLGLNAIRISAEAEREWQQEMQKPRPDLETRTAERAVKAGNAGVKSDLHISKKRRARNPQRIARNRRKRGKPANQEGRQT